RVIPELVEGLSRVGVSRRRLRSPHADTHHDQDAIAHRPGGRPLLRSRRVVRRDRRLLHRLRSLVDRRDRLAPALGLGRSSGREAGAAVSWAAHDLEPYVFQRKLRTGAAISFVAVVLGSWGPDLATKWLVYGTTVFGVRLKVPDPVQFHRGWPGVGFTHSLTFGVVVAALVYVFTRSKPWVIGLLLGFWMHVLSDTGDTVGTMLFFPWTKHFALGAWAYAGQTGRHLDAAA